MHRPPAADPRADYRRLVSYSLYAGGAVLADASLGGTLTDAFRSPLGIALQIVMLLALVALVRVDWARLLRGAREEHRPRRRPAPR